MTNQPSSLDNPSPGFTTSLVEEDDINQEIELRKLEGVENPSKAIVRKELSGDRIIYFWDITYEIQVSYPWSRVNLAGQSQAISTLLDWAEDQGSEVVAIIEAFLDDSEKNLTKTIELLRSLGYVTKPTTKASTVKKMSISNILRRALPLSKDEMITLVQDVSPTTPRPAATVRQFIRTNTRNKSIFEKEGVYYVSDCD